MMSLNNSTNNSCFSAIFDHSDPYENYPEKKMLIKKALWLQPQTRTSMDELQKWR